MSGASPRSSKASGTYKAVAKQDPDQGLLRDATDTNQVELVGTTEVKIRRESLKKANDVSASRQSKGSEMGDINPALLVGDEDLKDQEMGHETFYSWRGKAVHYLTLVIQMIDSISDMYGAYNYLIQAGIYSGGGMLYKMKPDPDNPGKKIKKEIPIIVDSSDPDYNAEKAAGYADTANILYFFAFAAIFILFFNNTIRWKMSRHPIWTYPIYLLTLGPLVGDLGLVDRHAPDSESIFTRFQVFLGLNDLTSSQLLDTMVESTLSSILSVFAVMYGMFSGAVIPPFVTTNIYISNFVIWFGWIFWSYDVAPTAYWRKWSAGMFFAAIVGSQIRFTVFVSVCAGVMFGGKSDPSQYTFLLVGGGSFFALLMFNNYRWINRESPDETVSYKLSVSLMLLPNSLRMPVWDLDLIDFLLVPIWATLLFVYYENNFETGAIIRSDGMIGFFYPINLMVRPACCLFTYAVGYWLFGTERIQRDVLDLEDAELDGSHGPPQQSSSCLDVDVSGCLYEAAQIDDTVFGPHSCCYGDWLRKLLRRNGSSFGILLTYIYQLIFYIVVMWWTVDQSDNADNPNGPKVGDMVANVKWKFRRDMHGYFFLVHFFFAYFWQHKMACFRDQYTTFVMTSVIIYAVYYLDHAVWHEIWW